MGVAVLCTFLLVGGIGCVLKYLAVYTPETRTSMHIVFVSL